MYQKTAGRMASNVGREQKYPESVIITEHSLPMTQKGRKQMTMYCNKCILVINAIGDSANKYLKDVENF